VGFGDKREEKRTEKRERKSRHAIPPGPVPLTSNVKYMPHAFPPAHPSIPSLDAYANVSLSKKRLKYESRSAAARFDVPS
jgi:hypothetical protein